ncbi:MAG: YihY/virulence factor BrkB family protein [Myxococcota bacterium]
MAIQDRGRGAGRPGQLGFRGWVDVAHRVKDALQEDHIPVIAAGVALYGFLAIFPAIAAVISVYGLLADPSQVEEQLLAVGGLLPDAVLEVLRDQMNRVAATSSTTLGGGAVLSVLLALWSANRGMRSLVEALNVAYDERDERGLVKRYALSLVLTLGAVATAVVAVLLVVGIPVLLGTVGLEREGRTMIDVLRWPLIAAILLMGLGVVYRFGPDRERPRWRWVTPGSVLAVALWLAGSLLFSFYVENFGSYNETYGALGAVAILLLWFFLSAFIVLLGAEVNAESERQTRQDSTTGEPRDLGDRGAYAADTVGDSHT